MGYPLLQRQHVELVANRCTIKINRDGWHFLVSAPHRNCNTPAGEYTFTPDISYEYLVQLTGWLAGLMARVGIQDDKGGPASLAKSLAYIHKRGFALQDIDDKAQEKWDVMARLLAKKGAANG